MQEPEYTLTPLLFVIIDSPKLDIFNTPLILKSFCPVAFMRFLRRIDYSVLGWLCLALSGVHYKRMKKCNFIFFYFLFFFFLVYFWVWDFLGGWVALGFLSHYLYYFNHLLQSHISSHFSTGTCCSMFWENTLLLQTHRLWVEMLFYIL